jgi:hypothetical protein
VNIQKVRSIRENTPKHVLSTQPLDDSCSFMILDVTSQTTAVRLVVQNDAHEGSRFGRCIRKFETIRRHQKEMAGNEASVRPASARRLVENIASRNVIVDIFPFQRSNEI